MQFLGWVAIFLATSIVAPPWWSPNPFLMTVYRSLVVSHFLFGGLLWLGLITWSLASKGGLLSRFRPQFTADLGSTAIILNASRSRK